jgi:hypothetical protein
MSQYQQAQPFSFTGMPSTYTGGYDVTQPQAYAAPVNRYADIMAQTERMGGSGGPIDYNPEWTAKTDAEKAAFYAESPFFSKVTQLGQNIFGFTKLGLLQNAMDPGFVYRQKLIAMGIDPALMDYSNEGKNYPAPTGGFVSAPPTVDQYSAYLAQQQADASGRPYGTGAVPPNMPQNDFAAQYAAYGDRRQTPTLTGGGNVGSSDGGGRATGGRDTGGGARDASGGGDRGTRAGFAYGGYVSMQDLQGPNPEGPDDGYAALKDGEYVINDQAVNQYGIELMNLINSGKISKGELLGLLEM